MTKLFTMGFFAVSALAVAMMALGMCEAPAESGSKIVVVPTLVPLTDEQQRVEGAHSRGATLFQYKGSAEGMALCNGSERVLGLDGSVKEIRLTSQEAENLTLCKWNPETGMYHKMQDVGGTLPGDLLVWDSGGLHDTKYTPQ